MRKEPSIRHCTVSRETGTRRCTRREFLGYSLAAASGALLLPFAGCGSPETAREGILDVPADGYPLVEVSGSYRDIGRQIGAAMREQITGHLELSPQYRSCIAYLEGEGRGKVERMLHHASETFPQFIEEVEGMAEALEITFEKLFAFQCRSEIGILRDPPGCSTIALRTDDEAILVHNEDGNDLNIGRMFLVKVTPPSGVTFISFVYPGLIPGNGPTINQAGLVQSTNYIQPLQVPAGIPRYFIGRAILEAGTLEEAVTLATMSPRAFAYHHNLMSLPERRILSVEAAGYPEQKHSVKETEEFYVHTNHFLHSGMTGPETTGAQPFDLPYESSTTRMAVLSEAIANQGPPGNVEEILALLSLHERRPYSPCRHPQGEVHGVTLGTAVFTSSMHGMILFHGNPCRRYKKEYVL